MPGNPFIDLNCFRTAFQVRERLIPLSRWKVCFSFRDDNRRGACRRQGICLARYWLCSMDRIEPEVLGWEMGRHRAVNPSMQNLSRLADAAPYSLDPTGKNDGTVKGERYFDCKPNHGVFVRPSQVKILEGRGTPTVRGTLTEREMFR